MKNKVLFSIILCFSAFTSAWSQVIPNYSFENWATDTNYLNLTVTNPPLIDTSVSYNPLNWTTSNEVTNSTTFNHKVLVTQTANNHVGTSAIQLRSDSLYAVINNVPVIGTLHLNFVCPGFAVCGKFPINLSSFVSLGSAFNPALLPGAGMPVSSRKASIGGYLKFTPVGGDTAYIVAILRKGTTIVAQATYTRTSTDAGYTYFEAPFVYLNCLQPDTMVYTLASGDPYSISNVALGSQSGLHIGSTLLADSIFLSDTLSGYTVIVPMNDSAHTLINTAVSIPVTANDQTCSAGTFVVTSSAAPRHGNISISGTSIIYTPNANYTGMDTFTYAVAIGPGTAATAKVYVRTSCGVAVPMNDTAHTVIHTRVHILVTANDSSCAAEVYAISQGTGPRHGTIVISGDTIIYTPDSGYVGLDTFTYVESVGGGPSATAQVLVETSHPLGINNIAEGKTAIYPNPVSNKLYVLTSNLAVSEFRVYDMLGKVLRAETFSRDTAIDVTGFMNGLYIIQFISTDGKMISSSRFTVIK